MRKSLALAFAAAALTLSTTPPASAAETLATILFGHPSESGIAVIILRPSDRDDRAPSFYRHPSPYTLARAQDEIASNAVLRASLDRRNIRPHNVLAVQTALDGSKIVYAR